MEDMAGLGSIDIVALAVLLLAALRGMSLGLIREVFSLGALAAAVIAVRVWNEPFAHWLQRASGNQLPHYLLPWLAGALLAVAVVAAVATFGRVMRQGARSVGLGFFDRLGGAALGVAEGAIAAGTRIPNATMSTGPTPATSSHLLRTSCARHSTSRGLASTIAPCGTTSP